MLSHLASVLIERSAILAEAGGTSRWTDGRRQVSTVQQRVLTRADTHHHDIFTMHHSRTGITQLINAVIITHDLFNKSDEVLVWSSIWIKVQIVSMWSS